MNQTHTPINELSTITINSNLVSTKSYEESFLEATGKDFNTFYKYYYPKLLWQIKKLNIGHLDADFITNEAFMHSLDKIHMYNKEYAYSTWLFHIAKNIALQHKKKASKIVLYDPTESTDDIESSESGLNYYINTLTKVDDTHEIDEYEKKTQLKYNLTLKAISKLTEKYKDIIKMCDIDQMSYLEIVEATGLPMQTVKNRLFHGRNKIIELLKYEFKFINNTIDVI